MFPLFQLLGHCLCLVSTRSRPKPFFFQFRPKPEPKPKLPTSLLRWICKCLKRLIWTRLDYYVFCNVKMSRCTQSKQCSKTASLVAHVVRPILYQWVRSFSMARARARPGPGSNRSFSRPRLARARAQPFFFSAPAGPGGPKLARPLPAAVIGHAHLPRFSCFANGVGKRCGR